VEAFGLRTGVQQMEKDELRWTVIVHDTPFSMKTITDVSLLARRP
jgi:hypothetical protein